jgi:hypothetical protein
MTGVPTPEFSQEAITFVINEIKAKDPEVFIGDAAMCKFRIQLINSDYSINRQIYQDKLHKVLSNVYNLFSSHESTIYQGVNTKYYYNRRVIPYDQVFVNARLLARVRVMEMARVSVRGLQLAHSVLAKLLLRVHVIWIRLMRHMNSSMIF